jgi:hypothetical protein
MGRGVIVADMTGLDSTIRPPPIEHAEILHLSERDDNDPSRWRAIEHEGEQWRVRRERDTVRPGKPDAAP